MRSDFAKAKVGKTWMKEPMKEKLSKDCWPPTCPASQTMKSYLAFAFGGTEGKPWVFFLLWFPSSISDLSNRKHTADAESCYFFLLKVTFTTAVGCKICTYHCNWTLFCWMHFLYGSSVGVIMSFTRIPSNRTSQHPPMCHDKLTEET